MCSISLSENQFLFNEALPFKYASKFSVLSISSELVVFIEGAKFSFS